MRAVWKFDIDFRRGPPSDVVKIDAPKDLMPLLIAEQGDVICLWAEVDPNVDFKQHTFRWFGTGHQIPYQDPETLLGYMHVGSILDGAFVWHCYRVMDVF